MFAPTGSHLSQTESTIDRHQTEMVQLYAKTTTTAATTTATTTSYARNAHYVNRVEHVYAWIFCLLAMFRNKFWFLPTPTNGNYLITKSERFVVWLLAFVAHGVLIVICFGRPLFIMFTALKNDEFDFSLLGQSVVLLLCTILIWLFFFLYFLRFSWTNLNYGEFNVTVHSSK